MSKTVRELLPLCLALIALFWLQQKGEIEALAVPESPCAQLHCPGSAPSSPVISLSKDVAAHDWVIDVKCSSNIKFV